MSTIRSTLLVAGCVTLFSLGCTTDTPSSTDGGGGDATAAALPEGLLLDTPPEGARPLPEVKQSAQKGDTVSFIARIGGRRDPYVEGRAMMLVIDPAMPSCADNPDDDCTTPWDYCCELKKDKVEGSATVQIVGADGKPLPFGLEGREGFAPLTTVTVVGTVAEKDDSGVMVVDATGIHLKKG